MRAQKGGPRRNDNEGRTDVIVLPSLCHRVVGRHAREVDRISTEALAGGVTNGGGVSGGVRE